MKFKFIPIEQIDVVKNVRSDVDEELGDLIKSVAEHDVLEPLLVKPTASGRFRLIFGHRRLKALTVQGEQHAPCIVRDDISTKDIPFIQLVENIQRRQMSPSELVRAFNAMLEADPSLTRRKIALRLGRSDAWVYDKYRAEEVRGDLLEEGLSESVAGRLTESALLRLSHVVPEQRKAAAEKIGKNPRSAREVIANESCRPIKTRRCRRLEEGERIRVREKGEYELQVLVDGPEMKRTVLEALERISRTSTIPKGSASGVGTTPANIP